MPVNLQQYRGVVGAFSSRLNYNNIQNTVTVSSTEIVMSRQ